MITVEELKRKAASRYGRTIKKLLLGENAAKLYDFDLDALAPLAAEYGPTVGEVATPLDELPADANQALLRNAGRM